MTYFAHFTSLKELNGISENKMIADKYGSNEVYNTEVPEELYQDYIKTPDKYIAGEKKIEVEVPDYDEEGNPIMIDGEPYTIETPIYSEEGNQIDTDIQTVIPKVQSTHKEIIIVPYPVIDSNYEEKQSAKRREEFHTQFFNTSLGWIRRSVTMQNGSKKDFLSDLLLPIKAGLELGQTVEIITYTEPDFTEDVTDWTEYQIVKNATPQFIAECLNQIVNDFKPQNESGEENSEGDNA